MKRAAKMDDLEEQAQYLRDHPNGEPVPWWGVLLVGLSSGWVSLLLILGIWKLRDLIVEGLA